MKRTRNMILLLTTTTCITLSGCAAKNTIASEETYMPETTPEETEEVIVEEVKSVVWAKEPSADWVEYFTEMSGLNYYNGQNLITMYSGYGTEMIPVNGIEYTGNAIAAGSDGKMSIYDYAGNELYNDDVNAGLIVPLMGYYLNPFVLYDTGWTYISTNGTTPILSADFTRTLEEDEIPDASTATNAANLADVDSIVAVVDDKVGFVSVYGVFTETTEIGNDGTYALACKYNLANRNCDGVAVVSPEGEYLYDVPYRVSGSDPFVNNYVKVTDEDSDINNLDFVHYRLIDTGLGEKYGLFDATTGKMLTDVKYDNIKYFEEGYCPVEKSGKWGYIDEDGKEVTDFVFDAASTLYDGKAYVTVSGQVGIIDLKATLEDEIPVTEESVYLDVEKSDNTLHTPEGGIGYAVIREAGAYKFYAEPTALVSEATVDHTENFANGDGQIYVIKSFADVEGRIWYEVQELGDDDTTSWIPETEDRVLISNLTVDVIRSQDPLEEPEPTVTPVATVEPKKEEPVATPSYTEQPQTEPANEQNTWEEPTYTEQPQVEQSWSEPTYEEQTYVAPASGIDAIRAQYNGNYSGLSCEEVAGLYTGWGGNGLQWTGYIVDNPQPGDIIMYYDSSWSYRHTAVYLGDGLALHGSYNRPDKSAQVASMNIGGYVHMLYFRLGDGALYPCTVLQTGRNNGGNGGWMDKYEDYYGSCSY